MRERGGAVSAMGGESGFGYIERESPVHRLTGASKIILTLCASIACMLTFDTRFLAACIALSFAFFALARIRVGELRVALTLIGAFLLANNVAIFLFAPGQGELIYGTRHLALDLPWRYDVTWEQLFYQLNVTLKYFSIVPVALIFFVTTDPSEFAASLAGIGVNYKVAYSVSLALRYIPATRRSFHEISQAQQARGVELTRKASVPARLRGTLAILFPLVFSSLERIETIANAMELRGFGTGRKRTWYRGRPFRAADVALACASAALPVIALLLNARNGGRFYNPFLSR
jgi:energy-coupling factor transport system permease protein